MAVIRVEDIVAGGLDSTGSAILTVYSKVSGRYAIYRTADQVMIQYSDDDLEGVNQRSALAPLAGLRGQVNGLLDALRAQLSAHHQTKANEYSRRLAYALAVALQGDPHGSMAELAAIREDLTEDRASEARGRHLLYAAVATVVLIVVSRILSSDWFGAAFGRFAEGISPNYWNAAAVGAIGAFFSIALQIRSRQVSIDLQSWDNIGDATLRVFVGATSAVVLIALLNTQVVSLVVAGEPLIDSTHGVIIAAFAAGFAERLVADFLSGFAIIARQPRPAAVVTAPPRAGANERMVAEGATAGSALTERPLTISNAAVVTNAEHAIEPNDDEAEASPEEQASGTRPVEQMAPGPVG